ncbi:hypothetical protein B0H21DRAFT_759894 [Amylocystis lapponica]|nr:hypothetical protein B0H21DRAFT_759894 [Amylocystis lapponica]
MSSADFSNNHAESSHHASSGSGLKLVLPSLKTVQALKGKGKARLTPVKEKIPRPIKLKPLREVLSKLIVQIKKKDDYAFFLTPVDPAQVSGYADVVKRPMDFGTMSTKVARGKYRSLEEFAADVRLVTANAKTFNPPGTIYYTEADKIEAWALEHIARAASTVIEYETDWNIEIERDDDAAAEDDEDGVQEKGAAMDVDEGASARGRSPSVLSMQTPTQAGGGRRTARGGTGKKPPGALSETLEPDGGMPGAKDGLGAFPPGSDWAQLMLALKLKGKRYRTKKERMRMERGGPPYHADGSLDYPEMEDPFSVLSVLVPEPLSRPLLVPLYPTLPPVDPSRPPFLAPVNISPASSAPVLPSLLPLSAPRTLASNKRLKRRHWTIIRNAPGRGRVKDRDEEEFVPSWKAPREVASADFGPYATLPSLLAAERRAKDVGAELGSEERLFGAIRESVEERPAPAAPPESVDMDMDTEPREQHTQYWLGKGMEAEEYLRDLVYGGVDGLAYVRSLAEFVSPPETLDGEDEDRSAPSAPALGMPLAQWVEQHVVGPLTGGRHAVLSAAARYLRHNSATDPAIGAQVSRALAVHPSAAWQLAALHTLARTQLDMAALIRAPAELFLAEDTWAGADYKAEQRRVEEEARERALAEAPGTNAAEYLQFAIDEHREAQAGADALGAVVSAEEGPEMLQYALDYSAEALVELGRGAAKKRARDGEVKMEDASGAGADGEEGPVLKKVRLNLLALAKRAPLDKIARLPADLVPEYLRNVVPTI